MSAAAMPEDVSVSVESVATNEFAVRGELSFVTAARAHAAGCALLQRGMRLTAMIQDGELQLMSESENVTMRPVWLQKPE